MYKRALLSDRPLSSQQCTPDPFTSVLLRIARQSVRIKASGPERALAHAPVRSKPSYPIKKGP